MIGEYIIKFLASGFFTSYGRGFYPGSRGTIPAWLIAFFLVRGHLTATVILAAFFCLLSVYLAGKAEKFWGRDSKKIVMDEWAGMFIALILIPYSLLNYAIAFVVFRLADAVKIYPADIAERLPGGWGVTADDVVAGIQANLLTQLIIYVINIVV
jgi:phosphatidylglycerophosphatase A